MKKILLVMDIECQSALSSVDRFPGKVYSFVNYPGSLMQGNVAGYLKEHGKEFDAVATFDFDYDDVLEEIQRAYSGPIILFEERREDPVEGDFVRIRFPVHPSEFNRIIKEAL